MFVIPNIIGQVLLAFFYLLATNLVPLIFTTLGVGFLTFTGLNILAQNVIDQMNNSASVSSVVMDMMARMGFIDVVSIYSAAISMKITLRAFNQVRVVKSVGQMAA